MSGVGSRSERRALKRQCGQLGWNPRYDFAHVLDRLNSATSPPRTTDPPGHGPAYRQNPVRNSPHGVSEGRASRGCGSRVCGMLERQAVLCFSVTRSEMRRFFCRPSSVKLSAIGFCAP